MGDAYILLSDPDEEPFNEVYFLQTSHAPPRNFLVLRNSESSFACGFEVNGRFEAFPCGLSPSIPAVASVEASQKLRGFVRRFERLRWTPFALRIRERYFQSKSANLCNLLQVVELGILLTTDLRLLFLMECLRRMGPDASTQSLIANRALLRSAWAKAGFSLLVPRQNAPKATSFVLGLRVTDPQTGKRWVRGVFNVDFSTPRPNLQPLSGQESLAMVVAATFPAIECSFLDQSLKCSQEVQPSD